MQFIQSKIFIKSSFVTGTMLGAGERTVNTSTLMELALKCGEITPKLTGQMYARR